MHVAKERSDLPTPNGAGGVAAKLVAVERPETTVSPQWVKLQGLALQQLDRFMSLEPKVLRGEDPEAIHDMRVASRRLQQFLDLIYPPPASGAGRGRPRGLGGDSVRCVGRCVLL